MNHVEILKSYGVALAVEGPELVIRGLKALEPDRRAEVLTLAKAHKPEIIRELSGLPPVDLAELCERLRAAGLHLHPRGCDRKIQIIERSGGELRRDDARPLACHVRENEAKIYAAIIQERANGKVAGLCELCGWAGFSKHLSFGWKCEMAEGWPLSLYEARRNCPLEKRTVH